MQTEKILTKDQLTELFGTNLLFSNLILENYQIVDDTITATYRLGPHKIVLEEFFDFSLSDYKDDAIINRLSQLLAILKAFKYSQFFLVNKFIISQSLINNPIEKELLQNYYDTYSMELYYSQHIHPKFLTKLEFEPTNSSKTFSRRQEGEKQVDRVLLGVGGGKDAIVAFELLEQSKIETDLMYGFWGDEEKYLRQKLTTLMASRYDSTVFPVGRLEKEPTELTKIIQEIKQKGIKPSTPAVSVNALRLAIIARVKGYRFILTANEKSADFPNTSYFGRTVNHQYSKSIEFEKAIALLIHDITEGKVEYFSPLKPMYEVKIAEYFAQLPSYFKFFNSCNRDKVSFCNNCSKCAFVYTILSAFLEPAALILIFNENLFENDTLLSEFRKLLGLEGIKPLECVGEKEEMWIALKLAKQKGHAGKVIDMFSREVERNLNFNLLKKQYLNIYLNKEDHNIPAAILEKIVWK